MGRFQFESSSSNPLRCDNIIDLIQQKIIQSSQQKPSSTSSICLLKPFKVNVHTLQHSCRLAVNRTHGERIKGYENAHIDKYLNLYKYKL